MGITRAYREARAGSDHRRTDLATRSFCLKRNPRQTRTVKGVVPWRTGFLTQSLRAEMTPIDIMFGTALEMITAKIAAS
jgi:hypothetical protein